MTTLGGIAQSPDFPLTHTLLAYWRKLLVVLPWRLVARRVRRYGRNTVRVPVRRVAATILLSCRDRRERHTGERHRQRHHDRRHQHQYALSHRFSPPIPWSASTDLFRHRTIYHPA